MTLSKQGVKAKYVVYHSDEQPTWFEATNSRFVERNGKFAKDRNCYIVPYETYQQSKLHKKYLKELTGTVKHVVAQLDAELTKPPCKERGERVAKLINVLEFANDSAIRYGVKA